MGDALVPADWSELLQSIKPFGETDLHEVLSGLTALLSVEATVIEQGGETVARTGGVRDFTDGVEIGLVHSESILRLLGSKPLTVEERTAVDLFGTVLDLALLVPDRRGDQLLTPMIAPMGAKDRLTGTIDRDSFTDYLDIEFAAGPASASVIMIGLDGMGVVNETLGHTAGDLVLSATADRLRATLRSCDVVSRLGGDVFGIYCPNMGVELATGLTLRLQAVVSEPIALGANELRVTGSAGVASRSKGENAVETLSHGDCALHAAKAQGASGMAIYDGELKLRTEDRRALASEFVDALADNQLSTALEPIVHLPGGSVVGVEAHVLWDHPTRGRIDRSDFIDLAELIGRVSDVERAVLEFALAAHGSNEQHVRTGVNLSGSTLRDPLAIAWIVDRLESAPHMIIVQVSESAVNTGGNTVSQHLSDLRAAGASIVLDDFGLSIGSMRTLHAFDFDGVKLHNSIVAEGDSRRGQAIAKAVYASAETVGFDVVHTGIETDRDLAHLMALAESMGDVGFYAQGAAIRSRATASV